MYCSDNKAGIHLTPLFDAVADYIKVLITVYLYFIRLLNLLILKLIVYKCVEGEREKKTEREKRCEVDRERQTVTEERQKDKVIEREYVNHYFTFYNEYKIAKAKTFHLIPS